MIAQILAVVIFLAMFILIIAEVWERHVVTLGCAVLTLLLVFGLGMHSLNAAIEVLNVQSIFSPSFWYSAGEAGEVSTGINWADHYFYRRNDDYGRRLWRECRIFPLALHADCQGLVKYQCNSDYSSHLWLLSFGLAMFIDSITVISVPGSCIR